MSYRIIGLSPDPFRHLTNRDDTELSTLGVTRVVADDPVGFPCRVSLEHAQLGERVLLLNYEHQPAATPYRASHAIYVRENATPYIADDRVPEVLRIRTLSVRAFDVEHMMTDADLIAGIEAERLFADLLSRPEVAYLHVHYAKRGCYAARVERSIVAP